MLNNQEKISNDEWKRYEKHVLNISKTQDSKVVKVKLRDIYSTIQQNQGFE